MAKVDLNNMDGVYFDVLREIGNIGAGNATTALAQLLNMKVDMLVPKVSLLDFKDVGSAMGGEEQIMAGIYQVVEGDISGSIMFLLEEKSVRELVGRLMGIEIGPVIQHLLRLYSRKQPLQHFRYGKIL